MPGLTGAIQIPAGAVPPFAPAPAASASAPAVAPPTGLAVAPPAPSVEVSPARVVELQLESVQREVDALRQELDSVRRRDEALHCYMRRLDEELRLAAKLQRDFLPKALPEVGPIKFHALFRPAGYVSGDLYDVIRLDERNIGFYLADAVGHGVPAAMLTMFIKHALQTKDVSPSGDSYRLLDPSEALGRLNTRLIDQNLSHSTFATALYGMINADTLELTLSRAGHPAPIILRADGTPENLPADGSLLGIFPEETYDSCKTRLFPGDKIIVYTDGVEAAFHGTNGVEPWRWENEMGQYRGFTAEQLLAQFAERLDQSAGSLEPKDDLTIIIAEIEPIGR